MNLNRMSTRPLDMPRSRRRDNLRALTSMPAGKVVPLYATALMREDEAAGRLNFTFEMNETAEVLMNGVYVTINAHFVPFLAFERFGGSLDIFNRSYKGQPAIAGGSVVPWIETHAMGAHGSKPIYKYLGLHAKTTTNVNTMFAEAYNLVWNFRAQNRSKDIPARSRLDTSLAPAFWRHENFAHIVPDFDTALMEGEVALNVLQGQLPLKKAGATVGAFGARSTGVSPKFAKVSGTDFTDGTMKFETSTSRFLPETGGSATTGAVKFGAVTGLEVDLAGVYAEMVENGITISLANIELARKTQAFARLREQFTEHDDDWIIDMLMSGLSIPDQALKQPILLGQATNVFGMNKRYSTDADALTASAVNGMSAARLSIRVPRIHTGGVIIVTAEVTPEQLFERQKDPWFHLGSVDDLPDALVDELDAQKVDVVTNDHVDVSHATPNGTFGYAPLNHVWDRVSYKIGGKFYRPAVDASFDEDRQRIWAVETANPTLSADFYLCTNIHQKPFLDAVADPFEAVTVADVMIGGLTVFGPRLVEAMNNYDAVMEKAPTDRIVKE